MGNKMQNREKIAFAAGLYEGEGTIYSHYRKYFDKNKKKQYVAKTPTYQLKISMTDEEPLEDFMFATGLGVIYGPYPGANKDYFAYRVQGFEKVQAVIAMLWPFLSPRRKGQAIEALTRSKVI